MKIFELTAALKYGLIGLGAILAILCFYLINKEQQREKTRPSIMLLVFAFMVFSLILVAFGFFQQTSQIYATSKPKSGFPSGALDGSWEISAIDTAVRNNSDFKLPAFTYNGTFDIFEENGQLDIKGYLQKKSIHPDSLHVVQNIKFTAVGPINNNYVGAQYIFSDGKRNGYGTFLARFNNEASEADAYFLFRPSATHTPFGLVYGKLTKKE